MPTLYNTPGVEAATHPLPFGLHHSVAANDCKRNALLMGGQRESANQNCLAEGGWRLCKCCFFLTAIFSFVLISADSHLKLDSTFFLLASLNFKPRCSLLEFIHLLFPFIIYLLQSTQSSYQRLLLKDRNKGRQ